MKERLQEPLSNETGATLGIKGRAGIVLAELLGFLASEELAVGTAQAKVDGAEGIGDDRVTVALEEARAALWWAMGRKITEAEQDDLERRATAAIAYIDNALDAGGPAGPVGARQSPALAPGDVVRLASGGPAMTVVRKRPKELEEIGGWFVCAYFQESTMEQRSVTLPPAALRRVEDEQRPVGASAPTSAASSGRRHIAPCSIAVFRGREDVDAERVKEVAETIRVLLQDAADEGLL